MIGTGSLVDPTLGLVLALGQVPADIPEGFATIATFRAQDVTRQLRLIISASFAIPIFLGVTLGFWAVRGQPPIVQLGLLAFTAGILLTVVVEEIVPEAHEADEGRFAALAFVGGFALFGFIAVYLG
ncbi:ZIP family metal transporter [Halomarina pelagica]|uniref:ZIP family metal transporter n=1 Tax=Halomarina pelagica TaxID=2961599 RepID=UPI0020C58CF9|nr:ZIP family metal transporter [Halomarina sp. BND7]